MKDDTQIQDRIRSLLTAHFEQRCKVAEVVLPTNCVHNYRHTLDTRKLVDGDPNAGYNRITREGHVGLPVIPTIGLCTHGKDDPEAWNGNICEDPIDAQRCPLFTAKVSREEIKQTFEAQIKDPVWVRESLPEVHGLLWALGSEGEILESPSPELELPPPEPEPSQVTISWWARLLLRLVGLGKHRVLPPKGL